MLVAAQRDKPRSASDDQALSAHVPARIEVAHERPAWEIYFADSVGTEEYARQMEYFEIEIAAAGKNGSIDYISQVAHAKPTKRSGHKDDEPRLWIGWKSGRLHAADRRLLTKAGVASEGKELRHYFSAELQATLEQLEHDYAGREAKDIKRTRFEIRPLADGADGDGYEFVVIEQDPPKGKPALRSLQKRAAPGQP